METRRAPRLPGSALATIYILVCLAPVVLATSRAAAPPDPWEAAAAAVGLAGLTAMAVQFFTSGRFGLVSGGLGIDRIMAFHKIAARWVVLGLVLHPVLYVLPTWLDDPALGRERLAAYLWSPRYRTGVAALAALLLLVLTSLLRERLPWRYESWRACHLILGAVAVGGGLHHALTTGRFSAGGLVEGFWWLVAFAVAAVLAVLYGWRWLMLHRRPWRLLAVRKVADRMWELDIQPEPGNPAWHHEAGQFVWMTVGDRRFPLFDHPFSIADSPLRPGISLIVKEAGDFTRTIGRLEAGTPVGLDGPHGDFVLAAQEPKNVVLLAGGVGIAPIMGLLRDMAARRDPRPVRLGYAAGTPANFACLDEIEAAGSRLDLRTMLVSEEDAAGWTGVVGRFDRQRLAALLEGLDPKQTIALMCGPGPMVTAVSDTLLDLGLPIGNVVYERFDYGGGVTSRLDRRRALQFAGIGVALAAALGVLSLAIR
jgi:predicted ferric reductase